MEYFGSVDALEAAGIEDLLKVQDIGGIVAQSIHEWFREPRNRKLLARLRQAGVQFANPKVEQASDKLAGTTWVITGTLSQAARRSPTSSARTAGRSPAVSARKTNYLLAGEEAGSKLDKATKLGVKIVSEAEFRAMLK